MNLNNVDISKLPADVRKQFRQLQVMHAERKIQNKAKNDFLSFVKCVWPEFVEGAHHRHIAKKFNDLATGKINRLIVNMPPRHTKSEFASFLLPAWMVGRNPKLKIIQATHTGELAIRFGRKAKTLIDSPLYDEINESFIGWPIFPQIDGFSCGSKLYELDPNREKYFINYDNVHPNAKGQEFITELLYKEVTKNGSI